MRTHHRGVSEMPPVNAPGKIPLLVAQLPDADALLPYLRQIDANRWYTNFGPLVVQLEQRFAASFASTPTAPTVITAASGTAGLELVLGALELPPGSSVLLPALTFVATATAVIRAGYRPLIGDVDASSWLLTPDTARDYVANHRVAAVMPVATFGNPQDVDAWDAFTLDTGIPVVIDAAGAYGNQRIGRHCHVVFSLHATKALAAGEGGLVVSYDRILAARVRRLSNFGIDLERGSQVFVAGENGKLSEYHAAVAHAALDQWPVMVERRRAVQFRYQRMLDHYCPDLRLQCRAENGIYPILVVLLPPGQHARDLQPELLSRGIETRQWYCPTLDRHPAFVGCAAGPLPIAHELAERLLGLPFFVDIDEAQMRRVASGMAESMQMAHA
ncbi:dTDP-4-amino-4,6-dideoxygalactose transaminase [Rhodanobacter sp. ANJX3]|uniref:DegT/DnrJ/EryC1/StrS family aminotransferase n=1 Tax=unclassified Rhodanobacter TaxID=2621553 RepID=UPI00183C687F|nr:MULTISPECIES: DegT/DnrJ/EryC1/StrS family aminotransferase [unclassified Rhodanobacter]MBB5359967.1 dTDP-4-amino-4,6-dideoxygalactose transaminase [Rhodanobacter sp. ANJX3]NYE28887.1 dTDP-4-amino-4,6-dideoxygalactose transaminase [Rhodanobacter sp. K2T2]